MKHLTVLCFYVWLVKIGTARAGTQWMGTVVKTCYKWLIWGGTSENSWYTAAVWHTERDCMGDGWLVAERERVYDCCSEALWEEKHPPHPAPPFWIIHLPSLSLWPPRRALISSRSTFPPPFVFLHLSLSISLSHALYPIGSVTLATLSKKPVCGKTEVGVLIVCLWESEMGSPSLLCLG